MARKARAAGGGTPATVALERAGVAYSVHAYEHDAGSELSYGMEAAAALGAVLGVDAAEVAGRVFKTLVAEVDGVLTVAVVPVSGSLDLKALAAAVGGKRAVMADPAAAERTTGYVRGGISPLGQRKALPTVVDVTALGHGTVFVSAGKRGLELELPPSALVTLTSATTAPLSR
jgi:Cys-tRNA(Pro)/Cys-tRNA(Cys) deacylase